MYLFGLKSPYVTGRDQILFFYCLTFSILDSNLEVVLHRPGEDPIRTPYVSWDTCKSEVSG